MKTAKHNLWRLSFYEKLMTVGRRILFLQTKVTVEQCQRALRNATNSYSRGSASSPTQKGIYFGYPGNITTERV